MIKTFTFDAHITIFSSEAVAAVQEIFAVIGPIAVATIFQKS
jgi:hypothetical protein